MRNIRHALHEVAVLGKASVRSQQQTQGRLDQRRCLGSLSLGSTADRRKTAGVDARRPGRTMELRRAEEVQKCADKGWKSALICLGNMRKGGVSPGSAAYNVALKACAGAGEWDRAAALLADMQGTKGATPDAEIVAEIEEALAAEGGGDEGVLLDDVSCDSAGASEAGADSSGGGSVGSKGGGLGGSGRGVSGSGSRRSVAGMHTMAVALGADGPWPSRRAAPDDSNIDNTSSSSSSNSHVMSSGISMSSIGSDMSMADTYAMGGLGVDRAWPSRRPPSTNDNANDANNRCGSVVAGSTSSSSASWGGWRWRNRQPTHHQQQQHHQMDDASHAGAFYGGRGYGAAGKRAEKRAAWPSSPTAPFAGSWGDD